MFPCSSSYYKNLHVTPNAEQTLFEHGLVQEGDLVVMTIGEAVGKSGHTNTMKIVRIGDLNLAKH